MSCRTCAWSCDILCTQETHFQISAPPKCTHPKFPHIFCVNVESKSKGVMIAVKDTIAFHLHKIILDPQGRYVIMVCDINSTTFTVANIYAPNARQSKLLHKTMKKISQIRQGALVICGDFNVVPNPKLDSTSSPKRKLNHPYFCYFSNTGTYCSMPGDALMPIIEITLFFPTA